MADAPARFDAPLSARARQFEEDAARCVDAPRAERHALGLSYSTVDENGRVIHVHPDGTTRQSRAPSSPVVT